MPMFAFAFDTCISGCAMKLRDSAKSWSHLASDAAANERESFSFSASEAQIRLLAFDSADTVWREYLGAHKTRDIGKGKYEERLQQYTSGSVGPKEAILVINPRIGIEMWFQPTR